MQDSMSASSSNSGDYNFGTLSTSECRKDLASLDPTETSPLIGANAHKCAERVSPTFSHSRDEEESCITKCDNRTQAWLCEAKILVSYAGPLVITSLLQHAVDIASIIAAGTIGTKELGAVSIANLSASISCFTAFSGLATSLDTLCAQSYGSGRRQLVGIYCQRMVLLLSCLAIPVSVSWFFSERIFILLVSDLETARLASLYLKILTAYIPGFIIFECGKRLLQVQGEFKAATWCTLLVVPVHIPLVWYLIGRIGFIGVPISAVVTSTLTALLLVLYVRYVKGLECWGGLSERAFQKWDIMIQLAIPDMIMVEAEFLAFEIMTIFAARFGSDYLAAQSIITSVTLLTFNIPSSMSIAISNRVSYLIGAGLVQTGQTAAKLGSLAAGLVGLITFATLFMVRDYVPGVFSSDVHVKKLAAEVLPVLGGVILADGFCITAHGLLRGIGKQKFGGPVNIVAHYLISIPLAAYLAFGLQWKLRGSYLGLLVGLSWASIVEYIYIWRADWNMAVNEAKTRTEAE